jgi:hypothetical protein
MGRVLHEKEGSRRSCCCGVPWEQPGEMEGFQALITPPSPAQLVAVEQETPSLSELPVLDSGFPPVGIPNGNHPFLVVALDGPGAGSAPLTCCAPVHCGIAERVSGAAAV